MMTLLELAQCFVHDNLGVLNNDPRLKHPQYLMAKAMEWK
jgi:hypothetical protein